MDDLLLEQRGVQFVTNECILYQDLIVSAIVSPSKNSNEMCKCREKRQTENWKAQLSRSTELKDGGGGGGSGGCSYDTSGKIWIVYRVVKG